MAVIKETARQEVDSLIEERLWPTYRTLDFSSMEACIDEMLDILHTGIGEKKRSSYGIVYVVNYLCKVLYKDLLDQGLDPYVLGLDMIERFTAYRTICVGFGIMSHVGVKEAEKVWPIILKGADHDQWEVKEFIQMFVRKMTKANKSYVQNQLIYLTQSDNPSYRRFASEALRPVVENRWIQENPDYALKVLCHLFRESHEFPRVSVGNNLSDLSRKNSEVIYKIVEELLAMNNPDSSFIAHRACRNLVKTDSARVLDLLGLETYAYKGQRYKR